MLRRFALAGAVALTATFVAAAPAQADSCVVAAAGDVASSSSYQTGAEKTGNQIAASSAVKVLLPGDSAYNDGTLTQYKTYFEPSWGPIKSKVLPVAGNHDRSGEGYRAYFGDAAWQNRVVTVCGWRIILVNQYLGISKGEAFIRASNTSAPEIVMWHAPRWSSGQHGSSAAVQPLWDASVDIRARIVVNGHDHNYERFKPMSSSGGASYNRTREFVTGLGGNEPDPFATTARNSQKRFSGTPGVLYLELRSDKSYGYTFRSVDGVVRDSGSQPAP